MRISSLLRRLRGKKEEEERPNDPYFYLLENPDKRDLRLCEAELGHLSPRFHKATYERSRGVSFSSHAEAYADWLTFGRRAGASYAPGKDTTLKIIVKVKDESELLPHWIEHHASIVGYENLIILDTGSSDPQHLALLRAYEDRLLVFRYDRPYDSIHVVQANRQFYKLLVENCRYLTVLDADEFLLRRDGDVLSKTVVPALRESTEPMHCGTWIHNSLAPKMVRGHIDWSTPISFSLSPKWLISGTFSGKAIIHSNSLFQAGNLGHNLHTPETIGLATPRSLGTFVVVHLSDLGQLSKTRELKHVITHVGRALGEDFEADLRALREDPAVSRKAKSYIARYFNPVAPKPGPYFTSAILSPTVQEAHCDGLREALEGLDFEQVVKQAEKRREAAAARRA